MHGRVKTGVAPTAEESASRRSQISKYTAAKDLFLHRLHLSAVDDKTKELTARLIELNPDFYSLWNLRKKAFTHSLSAQSALHCPSPFSTPAIRCTSSVSLPLSVVALSVWLRCVLRSWR